MVDTKPLIRVKQKYQVTLPTAVPEANIQEGDTLEVNVGDGYVVLIQQAITDRKDARKGSGLYKSTADIDNTISDLRSDWD